VELPNLEGQPGWVVVVVFALFVFGGLGMLWLKRKGGEDDEPADTPQIEGRTDTVIAPAGATPLDLVRDTMGVLATQAARHKEDADRAEQEAKELARQLAECERAQAVLQERHDQLARQLRECRRRNGEVR
jgi:hypothetical protein